MRARNLRQDPDASLSSDMEYEDREDINQEIDMKLKEQANDFDNDDLDIFENEETERIQENEIDKALDYSELDDKLIEKLVHLNKGVEFSPNCSKRYKLSYILCSLFYFYKNRNLKEKCLTHPIIKYLNKYESNFEKMKNLESNILQEAEKRVLKQKQVQQVHQVVKDQNEIVPTKIDLKDTPRLITKHMFKNRGIPKSRSYLKAISNPRMKQKKKYRKAVEKMVSKSKTFKRKNKFLRGKYQGEKNGISIGVNRAINIDG